MSDSRTGQVVATAADVYDQFFVPALFAEWAPRLCDAAMVGEGQSVLDVGCGTGVAARAAAARVGPSGSVAGLDVNQGMLAVARRTDTTITWRQGTAEDLPYDDDVFDAVLSQFALMFFVEPERAIAEMARVGVPGGQIAVAVWAPLDHTPGYTAMANLLLRLFGAEAADALRMPYAMGDPAALLHRFRSAGLEPRLTTVPGRARFPSIDSWVHTDIRGWTLADSIDEDQYRSLQDAARVELQPFVGTDGTVSFDHPAQIITATIR